MADVDDALQRLLRRLQDDEGAEIPTGAFQRLRRTAAAALRARASSLLRGAGDPRTVERLVVSLGELKGVAMKLGQILSYMDVALPPEVQRQLAVLQTRSQPASFTHVETVLRQDFGTRADVLLDGLERMPVSTASIGQVHRALLPDGTRVAVKVRHEGIDAAIRADFRSAAIGKVLAKVLAPGAEIGEALSEAEARFLEECDYDLERRNQQRFAEIHAADPDLTVPAVRPEWCSQRVLTMAWHEGQSLDKFATSAGPEARDRAGGALYRFYIGTLYRHGMFNADPHPGNLLFDQEGRIVILDYGCVRYFDRSTVDALKAMSRAVRHDELIEIRAALSAMGARTPESWLALETTRRLLHGFFGPVLIPGKHRIEAGIDLEARNVLSSKRAVLQLRLPGKLLFLFRIRFGLHSILARIGAELDWARLEHELAG